MVNFIKLAERQSQMKIEKDLASNPFKVFGELDKRNLSGDEKVA